MREFNIEHIGIMSSAPIAIGQWYEKVLGFKMHYTAGNENQGCSFMTDASEKVMVEFGKLPHITPLSELTDNPLQLHIALTSQDPEADAEYLIENGATFLEKCTVTKPGELIINLSDPWGNTIQLAKRLNGIGG